MFCLFILSDRMKWFEKIGVKDCRAYEIIVDCPADNRLLFGCFSIVVSK